jgi:hypothetical protein
MTLQYRSNNFYYVLSGKYDFRIYFNGANLVRIV